MAVNFTDYFASRAIALYWKRNYADRQTYMGQAFFNTRQKAGLDLKWLKGSSGLGVSLMPSAFDAKAKFRDHIGFSMEETEMPFFREGYLLKEKDRQELMRIQDSGDAYVQEILTRVFDDVSDLVEGARIVPERMIWMLLAPENGDCGISIVANGCNYTYDYDKAKTWKPNNYTAITTTTDKWDAPETADPLGDIQTVIRTAKARRTRLSLAIMNSKTLTNMIQAKSIHNALLAQNTTATIMITENIVKNLIYTLYGIRIVTNDESYKDESKTTKPYYPDGYVTLVPAGNLGTVWRGVTPEEADLRGRRDVDVSIVDNGIALTRIVNPHPVNVELYASEIVLPSFERMDDVYVMKVA